MELDELCCCFGLIIVFLFVAGLLAGFYPAL